ncbi:HAD-IA family hydrolase [Paenirhodobacter sp.]|uniref:HAD-IA family hydrolase n=1 Tax=Paenirhodobacter sp. TaxID=1965326 RepID=UPI003B408EF9
MKLAIFDVDGTISDSQAHIVASVAHGFTEVGLAVPARDAILSIVGLSLPEAMARLAPEASAEQRAAIVEGYKASYQLERLRQPAPLYPGAVEVIDRLAGRAEMLLGIATGKSRRGLDALCAHHGIGGYFITRQVSDNHPSKPHPAMVEAALAEAGVDARDAVMIGDTTYDIDMGRAAGVATIGVSWGYHPVSALRDAGAGTIVDTFDALERAVLEVLG